MNCSHCGFERQAWHRRDMADFFDALGYWWRVGGGAGGSAAVSALSTLLDGDASGELDADGRQVSALVSDHTTGPSRRDDDFFDTLHDLVHLMMEVSAQLAPEIGSGVVDQVNVSLGGVPKRSVASTEVGFAGLAGDKQSDRKHHGRPFQAVCLWSAEVIAGLAADGHPIFPGAAGENLTISGLDWSKVRPGTRLAVGEQLELEVSWPATPCRHQAQWFADGDFRRIHEERDIDLVRWYAWVRVPGRAAAGAPVRLPSGA